MKMSQSKKYMYKIAAYVVVIVFISVLFIYVSFFMYNNVYKTLVYTDEVLTINKEREISPVDFDRFLEVKKEMEEKKEKRSVDVFIEFK